MIHYEDYNNTQSPKCLENKNSITARVKFQYVYLNSFKSQRSLRYDFKCEVF